MSGIPVLADVIAPNSLWSATVRGTHRRKNRRAQNIGGFQQINVLWSNTLRTWEFGTVPLSLALVLLGIIPFVGTLIAWTLGALIGGWFVALEFAAVPFERRGLRLRDRRRVLGKRRAQTVGFGSMAFIMSAFAPLAIVMMPSAIAGGTLLARAALDDDAQVSLATSGEAPAAPPAN